MTLASYWNEIYTVNQRIFAATEFHALIPKINLSGFNIVMERNCIFKMYTYRYVGNSHRKYRNLRSVRP